MTALGDLLLQMGGPLAIIAYLVWETRRGVVHRVETRIEAMVPIVIALAEQHENLDADEVQERLDGDRPRDFLDTDANTKQG